MDSAAIFEFLSQKGADREAIAAGLWVTEEYRRMSGRVLMLTVAVVSDLHQWRIQRLFR
jgi:hypothetical protein